LISFVSLFSVMAVLESFWPRRVLHVSKLFRWRVNLGIIVLDSLLVWSMVPLLPVGMAILAHERGWGILNAVQVGGWVGFGISMIVLDLVIYFQHRIFHRFPVFWRLHRVHHTDLDIDVTTGNRFHPVEIMISLGIKMVAVLLLGSPPEAVVSFEILLNACSMFNHSNVQIHLGADRWLRLFLVTPDMHRVHHSVIPQETNSNFGFNVPLWDRLFGSYLSQPSQGHDGMTIGLGEYRELYKLGLWRLLKLPLER
jgi:sterol desaturase/sphingolipid hydroxylase (fatty acid hydroxylase superfamily)